jgi:hypothetical protein
MWTAEDPIAQPEQPPFAASAGLIPRRERVAVTGEVTMRRPGKVSFRVEVYDLSRDGCKAEFVERPELHERLWLKFDALEAVEARVRWVAGAKVGLEFVRPFHAAVFELLVTRIGRRR